MEPEINYAMWDYLNDSTFGDVVKQLIIGQCQEKKISQAKTLIIVNRELERINREKGKEIYKPITLSAVKYHWKGNSIKSSF